MLEITKWSGGTKMQCVGVQLGLRSKRLCKWKQMKKKVFKNVSLSAEEFEYLASWRTDVPVEELIHLILDFLKM